jgi:hypothetical protein
VTAVLLGGVPQPLPRRGQPVVLDLTDPDHRNVPARVELRVPVGTLGLQQQAERIQDAGRRVATRTGHCDDSTEQCRGREGRP